MEPSQSTPGCVLCLLQLSASMAGEIPTADGPQPAAVFARRFLDQLLQSLLASRDAALDGLEFGVIGQQGAAFRPLLPGTDEDRPLRPLADLAEARLEEVEPQGEASAAEGLAHVYRLAQRWLQRHPGAAPPLVVHCSDGADADSLAVVRRSLQALDTPAGSAVLVNCVFSDRFQGQLIRPTATRPGAGPWDTLWDASSPLPVPEPAPHALTINAAPVEVLLQLAGTLAGAVAALPAPGAAPPPAPPYALRTFHTARLGNAEEEWEDAFTAPAEGGAFALADGAGEGIFSRDWARLLTAEYTARRPDPADGAALAAWLRDCRAAWRQRINYSALRWSQQAKVDRSGAAATFLALRLIDAPVAAEANPIVWRAWAVGDSCLFWFRDDRLHAAFPLLRSGDFGLTPALLRTAADAPAPVPLAAAGRCRAGDLFVLATDAVAQWVLRRCEEGEPPDWARLEGLDEATWREEVNALRRDNRIVNDDCTILLVRIRVGGAE